jgi:hypothetical protein
LAQEELIGFIVTIWEGKKCRMNPILFRTRCLLFADYAVILASNGPHEDPNNPKRGIGLTGVFAQKKWKPANRNFAAIQSVIFKIEYTLHSYETS